MSDTSDIPDLSSDARTKVLIAEDDTIVALDLQGMITRLGYDVVAIVDNGQAAVAAARRFLPDVILLDMAIGGGIDGIDAAREINKSSSTPVVFCVSSPDLALLARAKEISYAGYLLKPINPDSLATTLDTVLYKYKLEKRAELAEERYRILSDNCEVLKNFMDAGLTHSITWKADTGLVYTSDGSSTDVSFFEPIREQLISLLSRVTNDDRLATVLKPSSCDNQFMILGVRNPDSQAVSALVIPLSVSE
ncbi:MAG TPA: response regulator [Treponemataceae bacterium]|nr:response regulator [Treponemataceae bacterium]